MDDASDTLEAKMYLKELEVEFPKKNWQLHRVSHKNVYVGRYANFTSFQNIDLILSFPLPSLLFISGAARNLAAKKAKGEFILFMDDDNYAKPDEVSTFVNVANHTGAQLLSSLVDYFSGSFAPEVCFYYCYCYTFYSSIILFLLEPKPPWHTFLSFYWQCNRIGFVAKLFWRCKFIRECNSIIYS